MGSESTPSGKQSSRPNKRTRHNKGWNICIGAFDVPDRRKIPEAAIIMKKAMVERLKQYYGQSWFDEDGASYPVRVFLMKEYLDK